MTMAKTADRYFRYYWGAGLFWLFIGIKLFGTSLATWSWWWILLPLIPLLSLLILKLGL